MEIEENWRILKKKLTGITDKHLLKFISIDYDWQAVVKISEYWLWLTGLMGIDEN
jgi:hypothetical protein